MFIIGNIFENSNSIKEILEELVNTIELDEVILYDKNTLIPISFFSNKKVKEKAKLEKICSAIKQFKSASKIISNTFNDLIINSNFNTIYMTDFTFSTYILIIYSKKDINLELIKLNLSLSKTKLEELIEK